MPRSPKRVRPRRNESETAFNKRLKKATTRKSRNKKRRAERVSRTDQESEVAKANQRKWNERHQASLDPDKRRSNQNKKNSQKRSARASRTDEERAVDNMNTAQRVNKFWASMGNDGRAETRERYNAAKREVNGRRSGADQDWDATPDELLPKIDRDPHNFFHNFEKSPFRSLLLWHLNSGNAAFRGVEEENLEDVITQILDEKLTAEERLSLVSNFMKVHKFGTGKRLAACAACGSRVDDPSLYHFDVNVVSELQQLRLTQEQMVKYSTVSSDAENPWVVEIVVDSCGTKKSVDTRDVFSCYKAADGNRYHIHPELVTTCTNGNEVTDVCKKCKNKLDEGELPELSIANGVDFGNYKRLGLTEPNLHEKAIISQIRNYIKYIKVRYSVTGTNRSYTMNKLDAHVVMFADDTTGVVRRCWKKEHIKTAIQLLLICPDGKPDKLVRDLLGSTSVIGRSYVVHQWLSVLDVVSSQYGTDVCPTQTLPEFSIFHQTMREAIEEMVGNAEISTSPSQLRFENESGSDVAQVRTAPSRVVESQNRARNINGPSPAGGDNTIPLRYSMVTKIAGVVTRGGHQLHDNTTESLINAASKALLTREEIAKHGNRANQDDNRASESNQDDSSGSDNPSNPIMGQAKIANEGIEESEASNSDRSDSDSNSDLSDYVPQGGDAPEPSHDPLSSVRSERPLNELAKDDFILGAGFPWVFPTGNVYKRPPGSLSQKHRYHLFSQFTNIAAQDRTLCSYLFDATKRAESNIGVSATAKDKRGIFDRVQKMLSEPGFKKRLALAKKYPKSKDAKAILRQLLGVLNFAGRRTAFGSLERNDAVAKVIELSRRYGCPSVFLTVSFDDINNPSAFRLSLATSNRDTFPSTYVTENDTTYVQKLIDEADIVSQGTIKIPTAHHVRAAAATENPVAYVTACKELLHDVLSLLIGLPPNNFDRGCGRKTTSVRKTKYYRQRLKGIFGRVFAIYGVTEEHAKGTLHNHFAIYGGLLPRILQRYCAFQEVCDAIAEVLDSMYSATLPGDVHHPSIVKDVLVERDWYARKPQHHLLENIQWCQEVGTPLEFTNHALLVGLCDQHAAQQRHRHCATCRKGFNGYSGCRLCKPSGYSTGTRPVVVSAKENDMEEKTQKNRNSPVEPMVQSVDEGLAGVVIDNNNVTRNPLEKDALDKKLVVWELNRPKLSQPLPEIDNSTQQAEELKQNQIQALYELLLQCESQQPIRGEAGGDGSDLLSKEMKFILEAKQPTSVDIFYKEVRSRIPEANGMVTESSPLLSKVAGCHNAAMLLGSMEQGKSALFYIANYIAKSKVAFEQCFTVLEKAIEHTQKYASTASDSGTQQRTTKHVLERTLNQLNLLMEISDYQAAAALIGLPTEITTDIFSYFSPSAAISMNDLDFVRDDTHKDALDGMRQYVAHHESLDKKAQEQELEDVESIHEDEDQELDASDAGSAPHGEDSELLSVSSGCLQQDVSDHEPLGEAVGDSDSPMMDCDSNGTPYNSSPAPINPEADDDDDGWSATSAHFSAAQGDGSGPAESSTPFYVTPEAFGSLGYSKLFAINGDGTKVPVPQAMHWRFRGEALRHLTRYEYAGLVKIVKRKTSTKPKKKKKNNREKSPLFLFGEGHPLQQTHAQILRSKQTVVITCNRPPRKPGPRPSPDLPNATEKQKRWRARANSYAKYALVLFRPEPDLYDCKSPKPSPKDYTWDALQNWIAESQANKSLVDLLRLRAMETHLQGIATPFQHKVLMSKYRGRNRKLWNARDHAKFNMQDRLNATAVAHDGNALDDAAYEAQHPVISTKSMKGIYQQLAYCAKQTLRMNKIFASHDKAMANNDTNAPASSHTGGQGAGSAVWSQTSAEDISRLYNDVMSSKGFDKAQDGESTANTADNSFVHVDLSDLKYKKGNEMQRKIRDRFREIAGIKSTEGKRKPLLVTGPPGVGKSHLANMIRYCAKETFDKVVVCLSYNGIAAINIGGDTVSGAAQIHFKSKKNQYWDDTGTSKKDTAIDLETRLPPIKDKHKLKELHDSLHPEKTVAILIDEISTMSPVYLAALSERCKQVTGKYDEDFGGLIVIFIGDFSQLPPVMGTPLTRGVIDILKWDEKRAQQEIRKKAKRMGSTKSKLARETQSRGKPDMNVAKYSEDSLFRRGCDILCSSEWYQLTKQERSVDDDHNRILEKMEASQSLTLKDLQEYTVFREKDIQGEQGLDWLKAPILVATNRERHNLLGPQCMRFGKSTGKYIYRWPCERTEWEQKPRPEHLEDVIQDPCFYEWFVEGADGFITDRLNKSVRLVNGTRIRYHSIVPASDAQRTSIAAQQAAKPPGSVIHLDEPPLAVNVVLVDENEGQNVTRRSKRHWKQVTLDNKGGIVIPILPVRKNDRWTRTIVPGGEGYPPSRIKLKSHFPIELAFAITIHKAQGRTLDRVIIAVSDRTAENCQLKYASLYVALSRVRSRKDIRLLVNGSRGGKFTDWHSAAYITGLRPDSSITAFFAGYKKDNTTWCGKSALEKAKRRR